MTEIDPVEIFETIDRIALNFDANVTVTMGFIVDGNVSAAKFSLEKAIELKSDLITETQKIVDVTDAYDAQIEEVNTRIEVSESKYKKQVDQLTEMLTESRSEFKDKTAALANLERELRIVTDKLAASEKTEVKATEDLAISTERQKSLGRELKTVKSNIKQAKASQDLLAKNESKLERRNQTITKNKKRISELEKTNAELKKSLTKANKDLEVASVDKPITDWVDGKNNINKYRIVESSVIKTPSAKGSDVNLNTLVTDWQLTLETSAGVSCAVFVNDWGRPVIPTGMDLTDYPLAMDSELIKAFEERLKANHPHVLECIDLVKNSKIEDNRELKDEEKSLLLNAGIDTLYKAVIFPLEVFTSFMKKETDLDAEALLSLYESVHYAGCAVRAEYMIELADDADDQAAKVTGYAKSVD